MIVTTANIDEVLKDRAVKTIAVAGGDIKSDKITAKNADIKESTFERITVIEGDIIPFNGPTLEVKTGELNIGKDGLFGRDVDVNVRGTLTYNGRRLEDMIAAGGGGGGGGDHRENFDCTNLTCVGLTCNNLNARTHLGHTNSIKLTDDDAAQGENQKNLKEFIQDTAAKVDVEEIGAPEKDVTFLGNVTVNGTTDLMGVKMWKGDIELYTHNPDDKDNPFMETFDQAVDAECEKCIPKAANIASDESLKGKAVNIGSEDVTSMKIETEHSQILSNANGLNIATYVDKGTIINGNFTIPWSNTMISYRDVAGLDKTMAIDKKVQEKAIDCIKKATNIATEQTLEGAPLSLGANTNPLFILSNDMNIQANALSHYTLKEFYPQYVKIYGKKYGHEEGTDQKVDYMGIVSRGEIKYWETDKTKNQNTGCKRAFGLEEKCRVSFEDHVALKGGFTVFRDVDDGTGKKSNQAWTAMSTRNIALAAFGDAIDPATGLATKRYDTLVMNDITVHRNPVLLPNLGSVFAMPGDADYKDYDKIKYHPLLEELSLHFVHKPMPGQLTTLIATNETDADETYNYDTDKVTNDETGEEEQGTNAPSIFTKGGILAMKKIISGSQMMVVDPADLTVKSSITPQQVTSGNIMADEWVTAKNATITEGISAQNGTFSMKLEVAELDSREDELPVKKRMKFEDPLQGDALNRKEATDVIGGDVYFTCGSSTFLIFSPRIVFHRVTEFIVYVSINGDTRDINESLATSIANAGACTAISFQGSSAFSSFPKNIASIFELNIPLTLQVKEKTDGIKEYRCNLLLKNGGISFAPLDNDVFEAVHGEGKQLIQISLSPYKEFVVAPSENSKTNYDTTF